MFTRKENWPELGALAHLMIKDGNLRAQIVRAQRRQRLALWRARSANPR